MIKVFVLKFLFWARLSFLTFGQSVPGDGVEVEKRGQGEAARDNDDHKDSEDVEEVVDNGVPQSWINLVSSLHLLPAEDGYLES